MTESTPDDRYVSPYVSADPAAYVPAVVALEGDPTRGTFDALVMRGQRWNGWACPVFPIASVLAIRTAFGMDGSSDDAPLSEETFTVDSTGPVPVVTMSGDGWDAPEVLAPVILEGVPYWPIGTGGWVWLEAEAEADEDADDEDADAPHEGHIPRFGGGWYCDTCASPYCDQA